ncbi:MAG TPA: thioredoxin family protein [Vicinamibacterales bacterium]|nr:thioredoxin family protein [Vicinamibacterales bacterium]
MQTLAWGVVTLLLAGIASPRQAEYGPMWDEAVPFHAFLEGVKARQDQWRTRFANAGVDAEALNEARALPGRRRLLAVAEDRCSDSAWALPYIAKLAAAVPEKLELRVIGPAQGRSLQSRHLTPDGRLATPTVAVLDEQNRLLGVWVERPAELQKWYLENLDVPTDERYAHVNRWYTDDAGRSTVREILALARRQPREGK